MALVLLAGDSQVEGLGPEMQSLARAFGRDPVAVYRRGLAAKDAGPFLRETIAAYPAAQEVWLEFGSNDLEPEGEFRAALAQALDIVLAREPPPASVVLWSAPNIERQPFQDAARRNNAILMAFGAAANLHVVDSTRYSVTEELRDGVHYTAAGYARWARRATLEALLYNLDTFGTDPRVLVALADVETGGSFRADLINPTSGATGLFQITAVLLRDERIRSTLGTAYTPREMLNPNRAASVAGAYVSLIEARFAELGIRRNLANATYIGLIALAYNAGLGDVTRALQTLARQGRDLNEINPDLVLAQTAHPERTYYGNVLLSYFRGNRAWEATAPAPVEPAPGRQRRGGLGGGLLLALAGAAGLGIAFAVSGKARGNGNSGRTAQASHGPRRRARRARKRPGAPVLADRRPGHRDRRRRGGLLRGGLFLLGCLR